MKATTMTLAKAMKHKNRVAQKLDRISNDIRASNSILAVNEPEIDVLKFDRIRAELMDYLVGLKTAMHIASNPVRYDIFMLSELRTLIHFYRSISTTHGKREAHRFGQGDEFVEYKAIMRKESIDDIVIDIECRIDGIQDKLDEFNAATTISISIPESMKRAG